MLAYGDAASILRSGVIVAVIIAPAVNYTILGGRLRNFGYPDQPRDVIFMARTYGGPIRYRF